MLINSCIFLFLSSFKQSVTQRLRWSKGYLQILGKYGKRLFKYTLKGNFSAIDMLVNITPANVLSWVSIIVNILAIEVSIIKSDSVSTIIPISVIAPFTK